MLFRGQVIIQRQVKFFHGKYEFRVLIDSPKPFTLEMLQMVQQFDISKQKCIYPTCRDHSSLGNRHLLTLQVCTQRGLLTAFKTLKPNILGYELFNIMYAHACTLRSLSNRTHVIHSHSLSTTKNSPIIQSEVLPFVIKYLSFFSVMELTTVDAEVIIEEYLFFQLLSQGYLLLGQFHCQAFQVHLQITIRQGGLARCESWGLKESDKTE